MDQRQRNQKAQAKVRDAIQAFEFAKSIFEGVELHLSREKNQILPRLEEVMSTDEGVRKFARALLSGYLK